MSAEHPVATLRSEAHGTRKLVLEGVLVGLACVFFWLLVVMATRDKSTTFDETAYLAAGISHLQHGDHRLTVGNGPFAYLWQSLPVAAGKGEAHFPRDYLDTETAHSPYQAGWLLLHQWGNDPSRILLASRSMTALLGAALLAVIYFWSRSVWGLWGGGVSLLLGLFCPTFIAHSGLATSDIAATLFFTISLWSWWSLLQKTTLWRVLGFCGGMALLLTTKLSGVLMLPVMALTLGIHLVVSRKAGWYGVRSVVIRAAIVCLLAFGTWYVAVWAQFGFRYSMIADELKSPTEPWLTWESIQPENKMLASFVDTAREKQLFPEAFIWGYTWIFSELDERSAYFMGDYRLTGWRSFFPVSFLIKTPAATLALLVITLGYLFVLAYRRPKHTTDSDHWPSLYHTIPLAVFIAVYFVTSITSPINIGQRHLLPIYPAIYILMGALGHWGQLYWKSRSDTAARYRPVLAAIISLLLLTLAVGTLRFYPYYLSYFNSLIGGPKNGWHWLVDSSLDWGQELPRLKTVLAQEQQKEPLLGAPAEPIYLSYFGMGSPVAYGIIANPLPGVGAPSESGRTYYEYAPGLYAISATMLTAVYLDKFPGRWTAAYEEDYQKLRTWKERRINEARFARKVPEFPIKTWDLYDRARFARLCAWIRETHKEPITHAGYAILVFRLTAAELKEAQESLEWLHVQ